MSKLLSALFACVTCFAAANAKAEVYVGEWVPAGETGICGGGYSELLDGELTAYEGQEGGAGDRPD